MIYNSFDIEIPNLRSNYNTSLTTKKQKLNSNERISYLEPKKKKIKAKNSLWQKYFLFWQWLKSFPTDMIIKYFEIWIFKLILHLHSYYVHPTQPHGYIHHPFQFIFYIHAYLQLELLSIVADFCFMEIDELVKFEMTWNNYSDVTWSILMWSMFFTKIL